MSQEDKVLTQEEETTQDKAEEVVDLAQAEAEVEEVVEVKKDKAKGAKVDKDEIEKNAKLQKRPFRAGRKKVCVFCAEKIEIDYKDTVRLRKMTTEKGKILPRRNTGTCSRHQRELATAIKRAREMALIPYKAD